MLITDNKLPSNANISEILRYADIDAQILKAIDDLIQENEEKQLQIEKMEEQLGAIEREAYEMECIFDDLSYGHYTEEGALSEINKILSKLQVHL